MIICDTSGLYAAYNADQPDHAAVVRVLDATRGPLIVSPYVLTELDYLLRTKISVDAELTLLRDIGAGAYDVAALSEQEIVTATALIEEYADRNLGLADAANVVLAARCHTTNLLTLDHRDYRIVRPLWGEAFSLVPADSVCG